MKIRPSTLAAHFSRLGMKITRDSKNPQLYLVHAPGAPPGSEPAKFLLAIPKNKNPGLNELAGLARLSQKMRKELLVPATGTPPFNFLQIRKITSW